MKFALRVAFTLTITLTLTLQGTAVFAWASGNDSNELEYQIKATYLYKFASYVEWPPHIFMKINDPVTIGVLAADEIGEALSKIKELRSAKGRRAVAVKILTPGDALAESLRGVQILFIGRRVSAKIKKILGSIHAPAVLIVTESPGALSAGSMINFVTVDERIRFDVSMDNAERGDLKISARLLAVAQKIETGRP